MGFRSKLLIITVAIVLVGLLNTPAIAYEVPDNSKLNSGEVNDIFKNTPSEITNVLKGLSGSGSGSEGFSINSFLNFKNFSANDVGGILKSVFGLVYKVLAVIVIVPTDALRGILGSISTPK